MKELEGNMKVYQLNVKVYILKDILLDSMFSKIAYFVDKSLTQNVQMQQEHEKISYKPYVIGRFKEIEIDNIYHTGKIYTFSVRTINEEWANYFNATLGNITTNEMKGLVVTTIYIPPIFISKIYTITPAILKLDHKGYWKQHISLKEYEAFLFNNSVKKYNIFSEEKLDESFQFYDQISFLNRKPVSFQYKNIHLLGDKIELNISANERAQKVAYCLLGVGILNNNARGFGYLNYCSE